MSAGAENSLRNLPERSVALREVSGCELRLARGKLLGTVDDVLFDPARLCALGLSVKLLPGALLVLKDLAGAKDTLSRFVALGELSIADEGHFVLRRRGALQKKDAAVAGDGDRPLHWTESLILYGLPVYTEDGQRLGKVSDARFKLPDGQLSGVEVSTSASADLALGKRAIPAALIRRFHEGTSDDELHVLIVGNEAAQLLYPGGLAASAGTAAAKTGEAARRLGRAVAKTTAARTVAARTLGLWSAFQEGVQEGLASDESTK